MLISLLITRNVCILSLREMLSNEKAVSTMVYLGQGVGCQKRLISMLLAYLNSSLVQMFKQYRTDHKPKV